MLYLPLPLHVYIEVEKKRYLAFSLPLYVIPSPTPTCLYRGTEEMTSRFFPTPVWYTFPYPYMFI